MQAWCCDQLNIWGYLWQRGGLVACWLLPYLLWGSEQQASKQVAMSHTSAQAWGLNIKLTATYASISGTHTLLVPKYPSRYPQAVGTHIPIIGTHISITGTHASLTGTHRLLVPMHPSLVPIHHWYPRIPQWCPSISGTHTSISGTHASLIPIHPSLVPTHPSLVPTIPAPAWEISRHHLPPSE